MNLYGKIHLMLRVILLYNKKNYAFIIGDSMVKDVDGYLLTGSIKRKFIMKVRPLSSVRTVDMQVYIKSTKCDFDPSLYLLHVGTNDLLLEDTPEAISKRIIATAESLKKEHDEVAISDIVARGDDLKEKGKTLSNILIEECKRKNIPIINLSNIDILLIVPQRHLNRSRLHFNSYGRSIFVKNIRQFMNNLSVSN